jgi:hypothetical protein
MDSNTPSTQGPVQPPPAPPDALASLTAAARELAAQDLDRLPDAVLAEQLVAMRQLLDGLEGQWLRGLATVDGRRGCRGRPSSAGGLDGVVAAQPAAAERQRGQRQGADRPGVVPRAAGWRC